MHKKFLTRGLIVLILFASCKSKKVYESASVISIVNCEQGEVEKTPLEEAETSITPEAEREGIGGVVVTVKDVPHTTGLFTKKLKILRLANHQSLTRSPTTSTSKQHQKQLEPAEIVKWTVVGLLTLGLLILFLVFLAQATLNPSLVVTVGAIIAVGFGVFLILYFNS